jgi:hypothetical protein
MPARGRARRPRRSARRVCRRSSLTLV